MRILIESRLYDTEESRLIMIDRFPIDGRKNTYVLSHRMLYMKKCGEFFFLNEYVKNHYQNKPEKHESIARVPKQIAKDLCIIGLSEKEYKDIFIKK